MKKRFLTIPETAEILDISTRACWQRLYKGLIPHRRWAGRVVVPADELEKFLALVPGISAEEAAAKVQEVSR